MGVSPVYASLPEITTATGAFIIRGYTMGAIKDGWLAIIDHNKTPPRDYHHGKFCVVRTRGGKIYCRHVHKGVRHNRWDLVSATGEPVLDVELEWCELVKAVIPHDLTPQEREFLGELGPGEMASEPN